MERDLVIIRLLQLAETDYKKFNLRLVLTRKRVLGVRLPALRGLAKQIIQNDWRSFLREAQSDIYEEVMLQGLVIATAPMELTERLAYISEFVPKIENWAVCDSVSGTMKFIKKNREAFWQFMQPYLSSKAEFELRFAVVILMDYYIDEQYVAKVLQIYDSIKSDYYYVRMAVAWGISVCFVKFPELTMAYLQQNQLDDFTYNKALQKIIESLRVDKATKELLKTMKRRGK